MDIVDTVLYTCCPHSAIKYVTEEEGREGQIRGRRMRALSVLLLAGAGLVRGAPAKTTDDLVSDVEKMLSDAPASVGSPAPAAAVASHAA